MSRTILISVKPEFADKIFNGSKTIELRKSMPKAKNGDLVLVYSTSPVKAIIGICQVKEVIKTSPENLWSQYSNELGIDKTRFLEYYSNSPFAIGIMLSNTSKLEREVLLSSIKEHFPKFSPPQTFRYFNTKQVLSNYRAILA